MTQPEKIKLVAEWMGLPTTILDGKVEWTFWNFDSDWNELHKAWKKLYPVLDKAESEVVTENYWPTRHFANSCNTIIGRFALASIESNKSAAFECLVEGIQLVTLKQ